jgi:hypothetical protein
MVMLPLVCMNFYVLVLPNSCLIIPLCGNNIMLLKLNYTLYVCYHFFNICSCGVQATCQHNSIENHPFIKSGTDYPQAGM